MKKIAFALMMAVGLAAWAAVELRADEENAVTSSSTSSAPPALDKLDRVLQKQDQILQDLAEIKSELQIVKIRATIKT